MQRGDSRSKNDLKPPSSMSERESKLKEKTKFHWLKTKANFFHAQVVTYFHYFFSIIKYSRQTKVV